MIREKLITGIKGKNECFTFWQVELTIDLS